MKFHIVSDQETLKEIAFKYDLTEEEIKKENKHIRMWNRLIPGTKLKIPVISEAMNQDLNDMEPFIEDYYPKLKIEPEDTAIPTMKEEPFNEEEIIEKEDIILEPSIIQETAPKEVPKEEIPELVKMKEFKKKAIQDGQNLRPTYFPKQVIFPFPCVAPPMIYVYPHPYYKTKL